MRHPTAAALLLSALAAGGCASHHALRPPVAEWARVGLAEDPNQARRIEEALTDREIATMLDADVRARLPATVALATIRSHCRGYQPYLAPVAGDELAAWERAAEVRGLRGVQPITRVLHPAEKPTLDSLRQAAAKMGCELLLVTLRGDSSVENFNDAAVLYWTVLGLWLVPGSEMESRTIIQAALIDSRTGMVLGTATGDAHDKRVYPEAFADQRRAELSAEVPAAAGADLRTACRRLLQRAVDAAEANPRVTAGP